MMSRHQTEAASSELVQAHHRKHARDRIGKRDCRRDDDQYFRRMPPFTVMSFGKRRAAPFRSMRVVSHPKSNNCLAAAHLDEAHDTVGRQTRPTLQTELADQLPQQNQPGRDWSPRRQLFLHQRLERHMTEIVTAVCRAMRHDADKIPDRRAIDTEGVRGTRDLRRRRLSVILPVHPAIDA